MKKKILICGGTGFIGYHLSLEAIKKGFNVTSVSTNPPKKLRYSNKVKYIECDLSDSNSLKKKIKGRFDYVINLAGYVNHSDKLNTYNSHYKGCKNLANFFLNKKLKSFIQIGSSVEYGNIRSPQKEKLFTKKKIKSTYGLAKLKATKYLINLYKTKAFPVTILRLYLVYGPRQDINRVIPITILNCLKDLEFDCSNGNQYRDFIFIDDLTKAVFKCLNNKRAKGEIINIGSKKPKKIKEVIKYINKKIKKGKPIFGKVQLRKDEIMKLYPDISKARKIINWTPKINFYKGMIKTINYYKKCYQLF